MKQHLQSLQAYRGFAALGEGAYHLTLAANDELGGSYRGGTFEVGGVGVDFFFVFIPCSKSRCSATPAN